MSNERLTTATLVHTCSNVYFFTFSGVEKTKSAHRIWTGRWSSACGLLVAHEAHNGELAVRVQQFERKWTEPAKAPQRDSLRLHTWHKYRCSHVAQQYELLCDEWMND